MRTKSVLTDGQYGQFSRRLDELRQRTAFGQLPFDLVMPALQKMIEGKLGKERIEDVFSRSAMVALTISMALAEAKSLGLDHMTEQEGREELLRRKDPWSVVVLEDPKYKNICSLMTYGEGRTSDDIRVDRGCLVGSQISLSVYTRFVFIRRAT